MTGNVIPDISQNGTLDLGEIDRSWTQSRSLGGTAQAVDTDKIYGHDNTFTVGASLDYGWTNFTGNSQLGVVPGFVNNSLPVIGLPLLHQRARQLPRAGRAKANDTYVGLYALDTFNATDRLALTGGARFNFAGIDLSGENGAFTNGYSTFFHVNPTVGLTYKITPDVNLYAGYAMTNRAPTPLELGCADPNNPCIIDNFLSSDPPLKQVIGQTFELGFRGHNDLANGAGCNGPRACSAPRSLTTSCRYRASTPASAITPTSGRRCARARSSRPVERRPVVGLRQLHLHRRGLSDDLHGVVALQSFRRRERRHPDHQRARRSPAFRRTRSKSASITT